MHTLKNSMNLLYMMLMVFRFIHALYKCWETIITSKNLSLDSSSKSLPVSEPEIQWIYCLKSSMNLLYLLLLMFSFIRALHKRWQRIPHVKSVTLDSSSKSLHVSEPEVQWIDCLKSSMNLLLLMFSFIRAFHKRCQRILHVETATFGLFKQVSTCLRTRSTMNLLLEELHEHVVPVIVDV